MSKSPRPAKESPPNVTDGRDCLVSGLRVNSGIREVMVMRVFVAGGTGVMGRRLVPQLVARGHQVTAIAGKPDMKHMDRWFATTNRLRTEVADHLLAAAEATGVSNFVAQSYASWNGIRKGGWVKSEEDPLDLHAGTAAQAQMEAIRHVEDVVIKAGGAALRYGALYGPGATDDQVELVRKRQFPLVGGGTGYSSWVHLDDAASATVLAVEQQAKGVFN